MGGGGVSLTPFRGSLSITAGTAIVEVLVGWSPASPQKRPGVLADFLHDKKKKNAPRLADAKPSLLEEENEALWKEFGGMAVNASQDYFRGGASFVWILHHKGH